MSRYVLKGRLPRARRKVKPQMAWVPTQFEDMTARIVRRFNERAATEMAADVSWFQAFGDQRKSSLRIRLPEGYSINRIERAS